MDGCSLENLVLLLDNGLNLDARLIVFGHLDSCRYCKEAVYQLARIRDKAFFIFRPFALGKKIVA